MASVAKWLRQRIVVPPFVGSSPIVRPFLPSISSLRESVDTCWNRSVTFLDLLVQIKGLPCIDANACSNSGLPYNLSIRELGSAIGLRVNTV